MKRALRRLSLDQSRIYHIANGRRINGPPATVQGDLSNVWGDLSNVQGDLSNVWGDLKGIWGDIADCDITEEGRIVGIKVNDLIKERPEQ